MTVVADASVVVAALTDSGAAGRWAETVLAEGPLAACQQMPVEVTGMLRRAVRCGLLDARAAADAEADLASLPVELHPYAPLAPRAWELRKTVTSYDAWQVALAESLDAELATLDVRLAQAAGPRCRFRLPR